MSGIGTGYDLSVSTFSPDGRVFQTEYAQKAVDNGGTVIGVLCSDGVILGVEKLVTSKLLVKGSDRRTFPAARHAGLATAGLAADGRAVVSRASAEAQSYRGLYGHDVPGSILADRVASFVHVFNLYWYVRPMGVASLLASKDETGYHLHVVDPAGTSHRARGAAVGKGRAGARNELEKLDLESLTAREAVKAVAKILLRVHDEEKDFSLELAWICDETGGEFRRVPQDLIDQADAEAKQALEDEDMSE